MSDINPNEQWFDAFRIRDVYAKKHNGDMYVRCPYCESLNRLPDDRIGHCMCGDCEITFNVK